MKQGAVRLDWANADPYMSFPSTPFEPSSPAPVHFRSAHLKDKFKLERQKPVYKARAELASKVPQFWYNSLQNCGPMAQFIDPVDEDALKHLKEVSIEHGEDVREFEVKFVSRDFRPALLCAAFLPRYLLDHCDLRLTS